jgi:hypothetical protein
MGRRHRHLNRIHCGAVMDYDARFVTGVSNGAQISTWANRGNSALNLSRNGNAASLTFVTNAQGGQPALRISNGNVNLGVAGIDLTSYGFSATHTMVSACKNDRADGVDRRLYKWGTTGNAFMELWCQYRDNNMYLDHGNTGSGGRISGAVANSTSALIMSAAAGVGSGGSSVRRSGVTVISGSMTSSLSGASAAFTLGGDGDFAAYEWIGDFYSFVLAPFANEPIRRRMEQSAAYSFKIANG